jgi:hypothetical protein
MLLVRGKPSIDSFAYDWRQSNRRSARDLNEWLCARSDVLQNRRVFFVAHSMGGLVLKSWLMQFYKKGAKRHACSNGGRAEARRIDIERIFFLGTPHLGSPKAIKAFAEGYSLKDDDVDGGTLFGAVFGLIDRNTFAPLLTKYGPTFPSAYELLPIYWKTGCTLEGGFFGPTDAVDAPLIVDLGQGAPKDNYDLFNAAVWRDWGWPKELPPNVTADRFYNDMLPRMLANAKQFLCDLAHYKMPDEIIVSNFVGRHATSGSAWPWPWGTNSEANRETTVVSYRARKRPGERASLEVLKRGLGDGTVPDVVAANRRWTKVDFLRFGESEHSKLLADRQFAEHIDEIIGTAMADARALGLSDPQIGPALRTAYQAEGALLPLPRDPALWNAPKYAALRSLNNEILTTQKLSGGKVLETARAGASPRERAIGAAIAATVSGATMEQQAQALQLVAAAELESTNYTLARKAAASAAEATGRTTVGETRGKTMAELAVIEALAHNGLGNRQAASKKFEFAVRNGYTVQFAPPQGGKTEVLEVDELNKLWVGDQPLAVTLGAGKNVVLTPKTFDWKKDIHMLAGEHKDRGG